MKESELGALLASASLDLEPPADLVDGVRRGARRARRRRAVGSAALAVLVVAGAASLVPSLTGDDGQQDRVEQAAAARDPRFPEATTSVQALTDLNGGTVLTFFRGRQWCTASVRSSAPNTACAGPVGAVVRPFSFTRGPEDSVRIDRDYVVTGLLGDGVDRVEVELATGTRTASTVDAQDFPRAVWWQDVRSGDRVLAYVAYAADGTVLQRVER